VLFTIFSLSLECDLPTHATWCVARAQPWLSASVAALLIVERVGVEVDVFEDNAVC
jgi:hypothetical protein